MPYALQVKYFNSFWLKKVNGDLTLQPTNSATGASTVTTNVNCTVSTNVSDKAYFLPTWPSLPWATDLFRTNPDNSTYYQVPPIFPWGGRAAINSTASNWNGVQNIVDGKGSELNTTPTAEIGRERNWFVEEARIDGGYNNTSVDFGVKAYLVEENNNQELRFNALIHSGVYNSRTGINETNVFSTALPITRALDPANNSIQKLYASDTNLIVFQEDKVSQALIDKDVTYTAEGGTQTLPPGIVLGQITPYLGKYGIGTNPESFGIFGFRKYFADVSRNSIMRLSRDGLTEISQYGMSDFFRDELSTINRDLAQRQYSIELYTAIANNATTIELSPKNQSGTTNLDLQELRPGMLLQLNGQTVQDVYIAMLRDMNGQQPAATVYLSRAFTGTEYGLPDNSTTYGEVKFVGFVKDKILGSYDNRNKNYVISIQKNNFITTATETATVFKTLAFEEDVKGWVSFYNYEPTAIFSVRNKFFSVDLASLYEHYDELTINNRGSFYGVKYPATVQFVFNDNPQVQKNFQTLNYEGNNGWEVTSMISDGNGQIRYSSTDPWFISRDAINAVYSYEEGRYTDSLTGQTKYAGFGKKENKYYANLINNSSAAPNEIIFGNAMSGIKGFFSTVTMSTDDATNPGGEKQLFSVGTKYVVSSY